MACTFLKIISAVLISSILVEAYSFAPVNLKIHTLNFNLTLTWEPPQVDLRENEHFLYTVERTTAGCSQGNVPQCVNISETFCSLIPVFPQGQGFCTREYFKVTPFSNIDNSGRRSKTKSFSGYSIEVSAPVVYNSTITDRNITLWIRGPETPFENNGRKLIMIERNLGARLFFRVLKFNASLFESNNPNDIGRPWSSNHVVNGRHKLEYDNLDPNTEYLILLQSYLDEPSSDITTFVFRTAHSESGSWKTSSSSLIEPTDSAISTTASFTDFSSVPITSGFEGLSRGQIWLTTTATIPIIILFSS